MAKKLMLALVGAALGAMVGPIFGYFGIGHLGVLIGAGAGVVLALLLAPRLGGGR